MAALPALLERLRVVRLSERPDLASAMWTMDSDWPEFMLHDPLGDVLFARLPEVFPSHHLLWLDADYRVVAKVNSLPFPWSGLDADLPGSGWDGVLVRGFETQRRDVAASAVSLLEARVVPSLRGLGLSAVMLQEARRNVLAHGLLDLFGPVRPAAKASVPHVPMEVYASALRDDGLPVDPWLRVHVVAGSLEEWRTWTGLPFEQREEPCEVLVPGALVPVLVGLHGTMVCVEPNVWVHHDLR